MTGKCTIVMYHYVRDLYETNYPRIRGLTVSEFREQVAYMRKFYTFVSVESLLDACHHGGDLPGNAALLTFDDGYGDHFQNVFPILDSLGIQGVFFPPVSAVLDGRVLDVNKIQFVLATVESPWLVVEELYEHLDHMRAEGHNLPPNKELYQKLAVEGAFDRPEIIFIKRLLQRELPRDARAKVVDHLFTKYVTTNELAFARELYMNTDQLRMLVRHGMVVGSHGYEHLWMNTLAPEEQRREVDASADFLRSLGVPQEKWMMCYPYGAHDENLRRNLAGAGFGAGVTTEFNVARPSASNAMMLPRLDTNHLPKNRRATPNEWTRRVLGTAP